MINKIAKFFRSDIFYKIFCFIIMSITFFVNYIFYATLSKYCLEVLNFIIQKEFFDTQAGTIIILECLIFLGSYPLCIIYLYALSLLCIICYYVLSLIGKKNTLIEKFRFNIFIITTTVILFFGFDIIDVFDITDNVLKSSIILTSLVMSIIAYMKIYCIDKSKYKTFTIISIGEIVGIPAIFEIEKLIKHLL